MRSMTGFGLGRAGLGAGRVSVEVRSLNHRYLDVRVRLPMEAQEHAFFVEQMCRERLTRGRYDVNVRFDGVSAGGPSLDLDRGKAAYDSLCALRDQVAPDQDVPLQLLASVPDMFGTIQRLDADETRKALSSACSDAICQLNEMRSHEGATLGRELVSRLRLARAECKEMEQLAPKLVQRYQERLAERVARLLAESHARLDTGRLELEVAVLADKSDVAEELTRLESHFQQFETLMTQDEPVGRAMDFLLQEMGREANTIGSKCQDTLLSHRVVQLKAEIERLREQVQNVE